MKLKTNSWHYKLVQGVMHDVSNNLCVYFWQIVFSIIICLFVLFAGSIIAIIATAPIWYLFAPYEEGFTAMATFGGILDILVLSVGWYQYRENHYLPKYKEPGIVKTYIKAKKEKLCPIIEWEYGR